VKALKDEPYTQKEAEAAIGLYTDNGPLHASQGDVVEMDVEMMTAEGVEATTAP
jgi:bud site selection protein 20